MAVSATVKSTLINLQTYYKSLFFLRWFFPQGLKNALNELELQDVNRAQDTIIINLVKKFYLAFDKPNRYTKIFLFFFSTIYQFSQSELIKQVTNMYSHGYATDQNLGILLEYSDLKKGFTGLHLLESSRVKVNTNKRNVVVNVLKVTDCNLDSKLAHSFYQKTAERADQSIDFSEGIRLMQREPHFVAYTKLLLLAQAPKSLAFALCALIKERLLPSAEEIDTPVTEQPAWQSEDEKRIRLQKIILQEVCRSSKPMELADAILMLKAKSKLEEATVRSLINSANPVDLAQLMLLFDTNLTQSILLELEQHRINLAEIELQRNLSVEQKKNISYCTDLLAWMRQSDSIVSHELFDSYDHYYNIFEDNRDDVRRVMTMLNSNEIWSNPNLPIMKVFLANSVESGCFFIYAELLTILAKQPDQLLNESQIQTVLETVKRCVNPAELLMRCRCTQNQGHLSLSLLEALTVQINSSQKMSSPLHSASIGEGLKQRRLSSALPAAKNDMDLEGGVMGDKPKTTPSKKAPTEGLLSSLARGISFSIFSSVTEDVVENPKSAAIKSAGSNTSLDGVATIV